MGVSAVVNPVAELDPVSEYSVVPMNLSAAFISAFEGTKKMSFISMYLIIFKTFLR